MKTYTLKRTIPVDEQYDLVVAGGGPAGSAATICAARLGARVLLVEATGCLGGMGTSGLVTAFDPMADGERMLVGGLMREIVETMYERGFLAPHVTPDFWRERFHCWTPFRAEGLKLLLDELVVDAGVEVRFFTRVIDAEADAVEKRVAGLILHNVEAYRYVPAKTFIHRRDGRRGPRLPMWRRVSGGGPQRAGSHASHSLFALRRHRWEQ